MSQDTFEIKTLDEMERVAKPLAASGFWQDAKTANEVMAKLLVGKDLGLPVTRALSDVYVVKGKPILGAGVLAALVKRSPKYRYQITEHTDQICVITFYEKIEEGGASRWVEIGASSFSIEEARKAGLTKNPTWSAFPKNMLFARALSNGVKWHCPDVVGGVIYTEGDDLGEPEPVNITPTPRPIPVLTRALPEPEPLSSPEETEWNQAYAFLRMVFEQGVSNGQLQTGDGDVLEAAICRKLRLPSITEASAAQLTEQSSGLLTFLEGKDTTEKLVKMREAYASSKATSSKGGAR